MLELIQESSNCMLAAIPKDGLSLAEASGVVSDDLFIFNEIQGLDARCIAIGVLGNNSAHQSSYKMELSVQSREIALVAMEIYEAEQERLMASKIAREGSYIGQILDVVNGIATQKIGRDGSVVLHDLKLLSEPLVKGSMAEIQYSSGLGRVSGIGVAAGLDR